MSDDIVERLRFAATDYDLKLFSKAADEVERLRAKVDELELAAELLRNDILEMGERETR